MTRRVGFIEKISGPVVVAKGLRDVKLGEVVEIGKEGLIGEVVRISGDLFTVQVYESTSGIKPGDLVRATGKILVAELGPGLLGSIFDGIQRPLEEILKLVGHFIKRGVKVNALPRDKKWYFKPTVKPGITVREGDVIGIVQETSIIEHKIMVPPNIEGELVKIEEGEARVDEPIAIVRTKSGEVEIKMIQEWPVRTPRPYKEREPYEVPLFTGQRVIDTFFPIAKGGAACIPGGFGTGKCIPPNTPVLIADGTLKTIDEIFREVKGGEPDLSLPEEIYKVTKPLTVLGFNGNEFELVKVTHVYRGYTNKIIRIKTNSGRVIEVTPLHKLLVYNSYGTIAEVEAQHLRPGMFIIIPRRIRIPTKLQEFPLKRLSEDHDIVSKDVSVNEKVKKLIYTCDKEIIEALLSKVKLDIDIERLANTEDSLPLKLIILLNELSGRSIGIPKVLGIKGSKLSIKVPYIIDENLGELLGLLISSGTLSEESIKFFNEDDRQLDRFNELLEVTFGIRGVKRESESTKYVEVNSPLLVKVLRALGVETENPRNVDIPTVIMKSPASVIVAFIRGLYLGNGKFTKNTIEYVSVSKKLLTSLTYLLSRLGILYSIDFNEERGKVSISKTSELRKFYTEIFSKVLDVSSVNSIKERVNNLERSLVKKDSEIPVGALEQVEKTTSKRASENYTNENWSDKYSSAMTVLIVNKVNRKIKAHELSEYAERFLELFKEVALDRIEKVEEVNKLTPVYDISVEKTHNFIGGFIPVIYHNTVTLHKIAMYSDSEIVVYVGCGERGNEMSELLKEFPKLVDRRTKKPIIEKSILIANTSNMPISAREASIYMGVTMAEYYRDMGYHVTLIADSTSRWAEALREISGRLEEMPVERGYPAYLPDRLAEFYERAGRVKCLGRPEREGSVTIIGAVSPPGGDFNEPVTIHTLRFVGTMWALDTDLAYRRHFPAINWLRSFSQYINVIENWWKNHVAEDFPEYRRRALRLLVVSNEIEAIASIVGESALPDDQRLILLVSEVLKEGFLRQTALEGEDTFCIPQKQYLMLKMMLDFFDKAYTLVKNRVPVDEISKIPETFEMKRVKEDERGLEAVRELYERVMDKLNKLAEKYGISLGVEYGERGL